jgi:putative oxidoreductase
MTMVETSSTTLMTRPTAAPPERPAGTGRTSRLPGAAVVDRAVEINQRFAPTLLRLALATVFVWFGALKLIGASPVHELIARTLPFIDADLSVPALGVVEVAIGLILAVGVFPRLTLLVLAGHLGGTFLSFVTASELMWGANFFELTADGEFVAKNLVLITAALVLIGIYSRREGERSIY